MDEAAGIVFLFVAVGLVVVGLLSLFVEYLPESSWECTEYVTAKGAFGDKPEPFKTCVEYRRIGSTKENVE